MKRSAWKASLFSMADMVQLVWWVNQSMLIYNISLYSWHVSLIKEMERNIRNFILSGDKDKRNMVTMVWKKLCRPLAQGGLNLRSLRILNNATNLHLFWNMTNFGPDCQKRVIRISGGSRTLDKGLQTFSSYKILIFYSHKKVYMFLSSFVYINDLFMSILPIKLILFFGTNYFTYSYLPLQNLNEWYYQ